MAKKNLWESSNDALSTRTIRDRRVKENMEQLLENEKQFFTNGGLLTEDAFAPNYSIGIGPGNTPSDSGIAVGVKPTGNVPAGGDSMSALPALSFAVLRRTFPALFANKVIGVQPMDRPYGMVVAQRYVYQNTLDEAGWDKMPQYAAYTGNFNAASGADVSAVEALGGAQDPQIAEAWRLRTATIDNATLPRTTIGEGLDKYPELSFHWARVPVIAKTRKLAASYTLEAQLTCKSANIDLERDIVEQIQYELVAEQDREIVAMLKKVAQDEGLVSTKNTEFGYDAGFQQTLSLPNGGKAGLGIDLTADASGDVNGWQQHQISKLVTFVMGLANSLAVSTHRSAGNFVIASPAVCTLLEAAGAMWNRTESQVNALDATPEVGTLGNRLKVYRDQYALEDYVLVGYKGQSATDAGVFYAPYVTALESRAVSAQNFSPRVGVMSMYALVENILGAGRYYRYARVKMPNNWFGGYTGAAPTANLFRPIGL